MYQLVCLHGVHVLQIAKEGTDQANHVLKNWQLDIEGGKRMNPITQELTLNSIGTPQFTLKQRPIVQPGMAGLLADRQVLGSSSNGKQPSLSPHQPRGSTVAGPTAVASVAVHTRSRPNSRANSLVTTAVSGHANPAKLKPAIAAVTLQAAPADDTKSNVSRGSCSNVSRSSRGTIPAAARSTVSSVARTNVSYPRTPQFSSVGSSSVANSEVRPGPGV